MSGLLGCGNMVNVKNQSLEAFSSYMGGGMSGGGNLTEITTIDNEVFLTVSESELWYEDNRITEYKVDKAALEDIEAVFRKYKMNTWNGKKFTNIFVADGPNEGYTFKFNDGAYVSFSSQIYPERYAEKLNEINDIVNKYRATGVIQPGLVVTERTAEEMQKIFHPDNGMIEIGIYEYSKDRILYRIMNGTGDEIDIPEQVKIVDKDGNIICERNGNYGFHVYPGYASEESIKINTRLEEGIYTLYVAEYSCEFEIKLPE